MRLSAGSLGGTTLNGPVVGHGPRWVRAIGGKALLVGTFDGIPGQYATIQSAVNAAQPGDWILIAPGDYHEQADHDHPPSAEDISLGWYGGVAIHTSDIHLRGMNRNSVIVDGTLPGHPPAAATPPIRTSGCRARTVRSAATASTSGPTT